MMVIFISKYIKLIFFKKNLFLTSEHKNNPKTLKNLIWRKKFKFKKKTG